MENLRCLTQAYISDNVIPTIIKRLDDFMGIQLQDEITIMFDDINDNGTTLAHAEVIGINLIGDIFDYTDDQDLKFIFHHDNIIKVFPQRIFNFTYDVYKLLEIDNPDLFNMMQIIVFENCFTHELKHLHQFDTYCLGTNDVDINVNEETHTYGFTMNDIADKRLENEARMFSRIAASRLITSCDDQFINIMMSELLFQNCEIAFWTDLSQATLASSIADIVEYIKMRYKSVEIQVHK